MAASQVDFHQSFIKASSEVCSAVVDIAYPAGDSTATKSTQRRTGLELVLNYLYLAIAIVAEVIATAALKASDQFARPGLSAIVVIGYAVAFYYLSLALRTVPLGIAYAIWACAGTMLIALVGRVLFQQPLDNTAIVGIVLMLAGAVLINGSSTTVSH